MSQLNPIQFQLILKYFLEFKILKFHLYKFNYVFLSTTIYWKGWFKWVNPKTLFTYITWSGCTRMVRASLSALYKITSSKNKRNKKKLKKTLLCRSISSKYVVKVGHFVGEHTIFNNYERLWWKQPHSFARQSGTSSFIMVLPLLYAMQQWDRLRQDYKLPIVAVLSLRVKHNHTTLTKSWND